MWRQQMANGCSMRCRPQEPRTSVPCVGLTSRIAEQFAGGRARWRTPPEGGKHSTGGSPWAPVGTLQHAERHARQSDGRSGQGAELAYIELNASTSRRKFWGALRFQAATIYARSRTQKPAAYCSAGLRPRRVGGTAVRAVPHRQLQASLEGASRVCLAGRQ